MKEKISFKLVFNFAFEKQEGIKTIDNCKRLGLTKTNFIESFNQSFEVVLTEKEARKINGKYLSITQNVDFINFENSNDRIIPERWSYKYISFSIFEPDEIEEYWETKEEGTNERTQSRKYRIKSFDYTRFLNK